MLAVEKEIQRLLDLSGHALEESALAEAQKYAEEALAMVDDQTDSITKAKVFNQLGEVYIKHQDYSKVMEYASAALEFSQTAGDLQQEVIALNHIAVYHGLNADYKNAMECFLEALEKSKQISFRRYTSRSLINIATIYGSLYNYQEAVNRYQTVLEEYSDVIDDYTRVVVLNNLGNIHYHTNAEDKALECFQQALELAAQINYKSMIAHTQAQIGRVYAALKKFDKSFEWAEKAETLFDELGEINGEQINLINFGNLYLHKKEFDKAIRLTSKGIETAKRMKDDENEIRGYQILAKIYRELKDFEKALDYQLVYSKAQERFAREQQSRQILDMEIQFAIREKQKEIEQLTKENEYQALLLDQSDQIANQNVQLLQVNDELRQFAYVASHDLKEPLRMIGSYTQLIRRKFKEHTDDNTEPFFDFVSEGVVRMNNLLDALLKYATVGKSELEKETVDLNTVIEIVQLNLQVSIEETQAEIVAETKLPTVYSVQSLLIQLIQNLVSNAIKFRKPDRPPCIHLSSKEDDDHYTIHVMDNGIGIDPEFQERIFVIFQRLHKRSQYEGTGIGLAICQKIVQKLGGVITVHSQLDEGATFSFTIPKE
jgi:signal transduction histidine kinase